MNTHKTPVKVRRFRHTRWRGLWRRSAPGSSARFGALAKLAEPNRDHLVNLHDEAVISREFGRKEPKTVILPACRFCEGAFEHALRR